MIEVDYRTFDVSKWIAKAKGRTRAFASESIQDLNEAVVIGTGDGYGIKVVTGFLRGSWYASLDGPPAPRASADKGGGGTISRMNLVAATLEVGQTFHAINGAAYAGYVHNGTAHMRPRPWVSQVLDTWPHIAEAAARRVAALP